jgi:hypothetical protein
MKILYQSCTSEPNVGIVEVLDRTHERQAEEICGELQNSQNRVQAHGLILVL